MGAGARDHLQANAEMLALADQRRDIGLAFAIGFRPAAMSQPVGIAGLTAAAALGGGLQVSGRHSNLKKSRGDPPQIVSGALDSSRVSRSRPPFPASSFVPPAKAVHSPSICPLLPSSRRSASSIRAKA